MAKREVHSSTDDTSTDDQEGQRRLHDSARRHFGTLSGGDPMLATESRERVRRILEEKRVPERWQGAR